MNNPTTRPRTDVATRAEANMTTTEREGAMQHRAENQQRQSILAKVASRFSMDPAGFAKTLRSTVFKGANNEEFAALLVVADAYKLNPLTKELYAFPAKGGGIVPVVSIDGWIRIMNEHPMFDGIEFNDIVDETGVLYAIESVIYRTDRSRPIKVTEYLDECRRNTDPWKMAPKRMLRHKSLIQGARVAFGFAGIYDNDDADSMVGSITLGGDPVPSRADFSAGGYIEHKESLVQVVDDDEQVDTATGEIIDDEDAARALDRESFDQMEGRSDEDHGDQHTDEDQPNEEAVIDPRRAKVEGIITDLLAAKTNAVVKNIDNEFVKHRAGMDDADVKRIEGELRDARARLRGGE